MEKQFEQFDKVVVREGKTLVYLLEETLGFPLPEKCILDIMWKIQNGSDYWKKAYKNAIEENLPLRYNELKMWLNRNEEATVPDTQHAMRLLDNKESVHNFIIHKRQLDKC